MKAIKKYSQLTFFSKFRELLFNPKNFFKLIKSEKDIKSAFLFSLIAYSVFLIWYSFLNSNTLNILSDNLNFDEVTFFLFGITGFLSIFVTSFFLKVFANILGSKNNFRDSYKILAYSYVPYGLFGFIPFVSLWSLVLAVIGVKSITKFSTLKSIGVLLITTIISGIVVVTFQSFIL